MSEEKMLFGACVVFLFTLMVINLIFMLYVAFAKLEEIESHLKKSSIVESNYLAGGGPIGRILRLGRISGLLCAEKPFLRRNDPQAIQDLVNFPRALRRWINIPFHIATTCTVCMIALWIWGEYMSLIN
jgi:hypothetical protein